MDNSLFYENQNFSFFDDGEEYEELVESVDAFEMPAAEAQMRIVYCKSCQKPHKFLQCPKPILH